MGLVGDPLLMGGLGARAPCPPLNPALCYSIKLEEIIVSASGTTENINNAFYIIF